jgi:hypothetical protein
MIQRRSAEQFLAELDEILRRFHADVAKGAQELLTLEEALQQVRKLGFTYGEALYLLRRNAPRARA